MNPLSLLRRWLALCLLAFLPVWPVGVAQAASVLFIATSNVPPGKFRLLADIARPHGIDVQVRYLGKIPADADAGLFQGQDMVFFDTYQQDDVRQHLARALPGLRAPHAWLYDARPAWGGGVNEALGRRLAQYYSNGGRQIFEGFVATVAAHLKGQSAQGVPDEHSRQSHPAATDHQQPVVACELGLSGQGVVSGGEPAAECGSGDEVDGLWQSHQVEVGGRHDHPLGERPEPGEAWLLLVGADLRVPVPAPGAAAATVHERRRHPVTDRETLDQAAHLTHDARELVPGHHRQRHRIVPAPRMPVRAADAGGAYGHHRTVGRADGLGQVDHGGGRPVVGVADGTHGSRTIRRRRRVADRRKYCRCNCNVLQL